MRFGKKSLIVYTVKSIYVEGASRSERKRVPKLNRQFRRSFDYIGATASFWTARLDVTSNSLIEFWDETISKESIGNILLGGSEKKYLVTRVIPSGVYPRLGKEAYCYSMSSDIIQTICTRS